MSNEKKGESVRWFRLQAADRGYPRAAAPLRVPWSVAEKAYGAYCARYGEDQSLERLAQRGGFGVEEMDLFYPPWRSETDENAALRAQVATLEAALREIMPALADSAMLLRRSEPNQTAILDGLIERYWTLAGVAPGVGV